MKIRTHSVTETRAVAGALAGALRAGDLVVLQGDLGGGKTAFVQGACAELGVVDAVTSPTFAIVQEYDGRIPVVHVDVYRLDTMQEVHDLGFDEFVDAGRVTFVEWGDRIATALPPDHIVVRIDLPESHPGVPEPAPDERIIRVSVHGPSWPARSRQLATALAHHLHPAEQPGGS
jgi:tRNA threonylcarbamoyladenosine biosynthesis protein TsaE